jgi:hypothetical protein
MGRVLATWFLRLALGLPLAQSVTGSWHCPNGTLCVAGPDGRYPRAAIVQTQAPGSSPLDHALLALRTAIRPHADAKKAQRTQQDGETVPRKMIHPAVGTERFVETSHRHHPHSAIGSSGDGCARALLDPPTASASSVVLHFGGKPWAGRSLIHVGRAAAGQ